MKTFSREIPRAAVIGVALTAAGGAQATPVQLTLTATNLTTSTVYSTTFSDVTFGGDTVTPESSANHIVIPAGVQGGILFSGEQATATTGAAFNSLITNALNVTNASATDTYLLTAAFSGMNFSGPSNRISITGSGTWELSGGSVMNLSFYVDPGNALGASTPTDHPGTLVGQFTSPPADGITSSFSYSPPTADIAGLTGLYSMTEIWNYTLIPGGTLVSRGQTESATFVAAEPMSIAVLGIGLTGLLAARKKRARRGEDTGSSNDETEGRRPV